MKVKWWWSEIIQRQGGRCKTSFISLFYFFIHF